MHNFKLLILSGLVAALFADQVGARTIYVDATTTNTVQNGERDTPYRTIAQISELNRTNTFNVVPGDSVYFRCDRSWPADNELPTALRLVSNVKYDSYYRQTDAATPLFNVCTKSTGTAAVKPILRGSVALTNLRWDQVDANKNIYSLDISTIVSSKLPISQLVDPTLAGSKRLQRARHPNVGAGNYPEALNSRYFHVGANTPAASNEAASYTMQLDPSAPLLSSVNLTNAQVFTHVNNWALRAFSVSDHKGDTIYVTPIDLGHEVKGAPVGGYWLENQKWMLDSPGEWFHETAGGVSKLHIYVAPGQKPPSTVYATVGNFGIVAGMNAANSELNTNAIANNFSLKNIDVQDTVLDGIAIMGNSLNSYATLTSSYPGSSGWALNAFVIDNVAVSRAGRHGMVVRAANGNGATPTSAHNIVISNSSVEYSMGMGMDLSGANELNPGASTPTNWMLGAIGVDVLGNTLTDIGLDRFAQAAISVGGSDPRKYNGADVVIGGYNNVKNNTVNGAGSRGIYVSGVNSLVKNNALTRTCSLMDDCGAIYAEQSSNRYQMGLTVLNNVVETVGGKSTLDGLATPSTGGSGVYLDNYASGVKVEGNSITDADYGLFLHSASNAALSKNMVDGSRHAALVLGQIGTAQVSGNSVKDNVFLANDKDTADLPAVSVFTNQQSVASMASFSYNTYGARTSTPFWINTEGQPTAKYSLQNWKTTSADSSTSLYLDLPLSAYVPTTGLNLVGNEGFTTQTNNWLPLYPVAMEEVTYLKGTSECYGSGTCVRITSKQAPPSTGRNNMGFYSFTPDFAVAPGHIYMVTFDARSTATGDNIEIMLSSRGAQLPLTDWGQQVNIGTQWKRYSLPIVANRAAANYSDGRIDLNIHTNASVYLDNVRVVEVNRLVNPETKSIHVRFNKSSSDKPVACSASVKANCSNFRNMLTGYKVDYTAKVTAWDHMAVYLDDNTWKDVDGDGVPGYAEASTCVNTPVGAGANEKGCGIGQ